MSISEKSFCRHKLLKKCSCPGVILPVSQSIPIFRRNGKTTCVNVISMPYFSIVWLITSIKLVWLNPNDSTIVTLCNTYGQFMLNKSSIAAVVVNGDIILKLNDRFMYTGITLSGTVLPDVTDDAYNGRRKPLQNN